MIDSIVVGTDGSDTAAEAVRQATELALTVRARTGYSAGSSDRPTSGSDASATSGTPAVHPATGGALSAEEREEIDAETLVTKVSAFVRQNPEAPVLIGGDTSVDYGRVYETMVLLQQAGAPRVGLMSQPNPPPER